MGDDLTDGGEDFEVRGEAGSEARRKDDVDTSAAGRRLQPGNRGSSGSPVKIAPTSPIPAHASSSWSTVGRAKVRAVGLGLLVGLTATGAAHPVSRAQIKAIAHGFIVP